MKGRHIKATIRKQYLNYMHVDIALFLSIVN